MSFENSRFVPVTGVRVCGFVVVKDLRPEEPVVLVSKTDIGEGRVLSL